MWWGLYIISTPPPLSESATFVLIDQFTELKTVVLATSSILHPLLVAIPHIQKFRTGINSIKTKYRQRAFSGKLRNMSNHHHHHHHHYHHHHHHHHHHEARSNWIILLAVWTGSGIIPQMSATIIVITLLCNHHRHHQMSATITDHFTFTNLSSSF